MNLLLVGSVNAHVGFPDGMAVLRSGGSAIDAIVAAIRQVEANPDDHSVGFSGLPNLDGDVELDASIMDGRTLATGAVAAVQGYIRTPSPLPALSWTSCRMSWLSVRGPAAWPANPNSAPRIY
jgi:hypothetical protein